MSDFLNVSCVRIYNFLFQISACLLEKAGCMIKDVTSGNNKAITVHTDEYDECVTSVDYKIQRMVVANLQSHYPYMKIMASRPANQEMDAIAAVDATNLIISQPSTPLVDQRFLQNAFLARKNQLVQLDRTNPGQFTLDEEEALYFN